MHVQIYDAPDDLEAALLALKDRILLAALPDVPFDGWTRRGIQVGAEAVGVDPAEAAMAFPEGPADLVAHFSDWADRRMLDGLIARDLASMRVRDRIGLGVRLRLEAVALHREAVRRAASFLALPENAGLGLRLAGATANAIWYAAGDTATDYNWYTKRGLLVGVLGATTLYWLTDESEGHAETWQFLDRRIDDVMRVGRAVSRPPRLDRLPVYVPSPARFIRQLRRRLRDM
ncbi:MAG TPA: COQ9 family protein [Azospirillaceae bacterium]|nr:COQ9 family protein [Azospirillaceae bacterium]